MPKLRESILEKIHAKKIIPRPRWQYVLLHAALWLSGVVTILLGSFAFAFLLLEVSLPSRVYFSWIEATEGGVMIEILPYLWGIGMIFALTAGYFIFSKTDRSYRFHASMISLFLILGSCIGGIFLYTTRTVHWGEKQLQNLEPHYREFRQDMMRMMPLPEEGILPLRVLEIRENTVVGNSPDGTSWSVQILCDEDVCRKEQSKIRVGKPTVFEGKVLDKSSFEAKNVLPGPGFRPKNRRPFSTPHSPNNIPVKKGE